ncbi:MAG: glycosyltransferase family 2 protein [Tissierellia bacterium]|nr:glycosyltransferase family 2 protein [Tissierellia bacterium]
MKKGKLVAVVPVYNEGDLIKDTIEGLKKIESIDEIVVVNDGSTDNTSDICKSLGVTVIDIENNQGKGHAIKSAIESISFDYLALVDGDLGNTSWEVEKLIDPVINGKGDVSIAKFPKAEVKGGFGLVKGFAKKSVYYFTGVELDTTLSGQRVYRKEVLNKIDYIPNRYGIELAMTVQTINNGFSIIEVPVTMKHRYSGRNLKGFIHRGKQFLDILKTSIMLYIRGYKR